MDITFIGISFMVIASFFSNQQNRIVCHSVIHESFTYYTVFPYPNVSHGNDTHVLVFSVSYTLISVVLLLYSTCVGTTRPFPRNFYRPQRSCKGYVFTGVCLSTGGGGWCLLPGGGAPGRGVPAPRGPHPGGCLVWEVPAPGGVPGQGGAWSGGCLVRGVPARGVWWRTPPSRRLLWRTVRILLECILVKWNVQSVEKCHHPRL